MNARLPTLVAVLGLSGLSLATPALAGEPILLPDFTPGTTSEFGLAAMLQDKAEEALARAGHVVLLGEVVEPVVGDRLDACADTPGCPTLALAELPARFGVVVTIRRSGDDVQADVALYEQSGRDPVEERTFDVIGGREAEFGRQVADLVDELAKVMGPADAGSIVAAARLITAYEEGQEAPAPGPRPGPTPTPEPQPVPEGTPAPPDPPPPDPPPPDPTEPPAGPLTPEARLDEALAEGPYTERHLVGVRDLVLESDEDVRDWMFKKTPHGGRTIIEVRGGLGIGDVDRIAYVRTTVVDGDQQRWFREGPKTGQRVRGELFVGYAPSAWLDVGALLGLQYGERTLDSAWSDGAGSSGASVDTVQAVQFDLEPRVRLYPVRTGPVKPYVAAGVQLRFFDQWRVAPVENITYAEPPAGFSYGPVGAVGLLIDPSPLVGFFVEGAGVFHSGLRAAPAIPGSVPTPPTAPAEALAENPGYYSVAITGGVQFRL